MAYIGSIKNKKKARKHLVETGKLPEEFQMKMVKTIETKEYLSLRKAAFFKWPFVISLLCNVYLIWRVYE